MKCPVQLLFFALCFVFGHGFGIKTVVLNSTNHSNETKVDDYTTQIIDTTSKIDDLNFSPSSSSLSFSLPEVRTKKKKQPLKRSSTASLVLLQQQPIPVLITASPTTIISSKAPEKRASSHAISSSILLKDEEIHSADRIPIPIIYHPAPSSGLGKAQHFPFSYKSSSTEGSHPDNYIRAHKDGKYYPPQIFSAQAAYTSPPVMVFNSGPVGGYSQPYSHYFSTQGAASNSRTPYFNDDLCPAGKPYPVYIEKKVPVTVEKRVPYPVKVPYPVHHYHYDNVVHRNINEEDLEKEQKKNPPPPPIRGPDNAIKKVKGVGGLFEDGDQGGFRGDDPEEEEELEKATYDNDYYEPGPSNYEAKRNIPKATKSPRPIGLRRKNPRQRTTSKEEAVKKRDASEELLVPGLNVLKNELSNDTQTNSSKVEVKKNSTG